MMFVFAGFPALRKCHSCVKFKQGQGPTTVFLTFTSLGASSVINYTVTVTVFIIKFQNGFPVVDYKTLKERWKNITL